MDDVRAQPVKFAVVEVVRIDRLVAICRIGNRLVAVPTSRMLSGTDIANVRDRGRLVIGRELAADLGLM